MNAQRSRTLSDLLILLLIPAPLTGIALIILSVYVLADQPSINLNLNNDEAPAAAVVQATRTISPQAAMIATVSSAPVRQYTPPDVSGGESLEVAAAMGYSEQMISLGQRNFLSVCSACHNTDGRGIMGLGKTLVNSEFVNTRSDEDLLQFIIAGRPPWDPANTTGVEMPIRGGNPGLTDDDLRGIIAYIRILNGDVIPPSSDSVAAAPEAVAEAPAAGSDTTSPSEGFTPLTPGQILGSDSAEASDQTPSEQWAYPDISGLLASLGIQLQYAPPRPERDGATVYNELCGLRYEKDFAINTLPDFCEYLVEVVEAGSTDMTALADLLTHGNPIWNNDEVSVHVPARGGYPPLTDSEIQDFLAYLLAEFGE